MFGPQPLGYWWRGGLTGDEAQWDEMVFGGMPLKGIQGPDPFPSFASGYNDVNSPAVSYPHLPS